MTDRAIYAVVVEGWNQAPILMETEGGNSSFEDAWMRLKSLTGPKGSFFRGCVVRLELVDGNAAVLPAMASLQPDEEELPF